MGRRHDGQDRSQSESRGELHVSGNVKREDRMCLYCPEVVLVPYKR